MLIITRETMLFVNIRLAYLASNRNASRISSKTVLFTSLPDILLSEAALKRSLTGIKRVWIATDCKHLIKLVEDFENIAIMLENAEISLARDAHKAYLELKRKSDGNAGENEPREEARAAIDETRRPVHRLKPLVGDKVDTIDWCRQYLELLQPKIEEARLANEDGQNLSIPVAFVEFDTQSAAQVAFQRGFPDEPLLAPRYIGVTPSEVVWDNLSIRPAQRKARMYLAMAAIAWVILFWTVPVAIIGTISNIGYLTEKVPFLRFLNDLPPSVLGVVTGLLPTVLLSSLMSLVPYICRCEYPFILSMRAILNHNSLCKVGRRVDSIRNRTPYPDMVLRLPSGSGVFGYDFQLGCCQCSRSDMGRPYHGCTSTCHESP